MGPLTGLATITTALLVLTVVAGIAVVALTAWAVTDIRRSRATGVATSDSTVSQAPVAATTAASTRQLRPVGSH
ncbi:hypothetical protein BCF74_11311 [Knoellia remsis]|uniref:Uncharacterized protein n=1 Tax=Knoellia remsis TaxID=407159 RepID=A0A2T0UJG4_9MICO|nr:hypothetical protein [Knoellia remsis]PRY58089.1 hypothetical protein BCF74_11311 [Knoellia remsis]